MTSTDALDALLARWRDDAAVLRRHGAPGPATALEQAADDLEEWWSARRREALPVAVGSAESGYSESRLYEILSERPDLNVGRPGAPRIRRCDLPRKAGHGTVSVEREADGTPSVADAALRAREGG